MSEVTNQGLVSLSESETGLTIDRYLSRAEVQLQLIKDLVTQLKTDGQLLADTYFKIKNFLFNLTSMQDLFKNAETKLGAFPDFQAISKRRFAALETQISVGQSFSDELLT